MWDENHVTTSDLHQARKHHQMPATGIGLSRLRFIMASLSAVQGTALNVQERTKLHTPTESLIPCESEILRTLWKIRRPSRQKRA